jgi:hypothetical protein
MALMFTSISRSTGVIRDGQANSLSSCPHREECELETPAIEHPLHFFPICNIRVTLVSGSKMLNRVRGNEIIDYENNRSEAHHSRNAGD